MPTAPVLTPEMRIEAHARSLELRRERAHIKGWIAELPTDVRRFKRAFMHFPEAQGMKVVDLLMALPGVGATKAARLLEAAGIPEKNTVRACGPKQKERLFALIQK